MRSYGPQPDTPRIIVSSSRMCVQWFWCHCDTVFIHIHACSSTAAFIFIFFVCSWAVALFGSEKFFHFKLLIQIQHFIYLICALALFGCFFFFFSFSRLFKYSVFFSVLFGWEIVFSFYCLFKYNSLFIYLICALRVCFFFSFHFHACSNTAVCFILLVLFYFLCSCAPVPLGCWRQCAFFKELTSCRE